MKLLVSKTYEAFSSDESENEMVKSGFEFENEEFSPREVIEMILNEGFTETSCSPLTMENTNMFWFSTPDPEINFRTGEHTYYSLHIQTVPKVLNFLAQRAGIIK